MLNNILVFYFAIALIVFCFWLRLFLKDRTTPNNHLGSWLVLLIVPFFWPIALPLSAIELLTKARKKHRHKTVIKSLQQIKSFNSENLEAGYHES